MTNVEEPLHIKAPLVTIRIKAAQESPKLPRRAPRESKKLKLLSKNFPNIFHINVVFYYKLGIN